MNVQDIGQLYNTTHNLELLEDIKVRRIFSNPLISLNYFDNFILKIIGKFAIG